MADTAPQRSLCSFDARGVRSWTDLTTAHVFVSSLDVSLARELMESSLPPFVLPEFLHEATHFYCLRSPVGFAAALLEQEVLSPTTCPGHRAVAHARINLLLTLYRPWLEGLALFAEFDASPGSAKSISQPLLTLVHFYRASINQPSDDPWFDLFKTLSTVRQSEKLISKKQLLLSTPWAPDGYLSGYMAAKNASYAMRQMAGDPFGDTDFALEYMIRYFFYDYELVDLLTSPLSELRLDALQDHAIRRMEGLLVDGDILAARAADIERRLADAEGVSGAESMLFSSADRELADRLHNELTERVERLPAEGQELIARRRILRLCSADVELVSAGNQKLRVRVQGEDIIEFPTDAPIPAGDSQPAMIDVYFDGSRSLTGMLIRSDSGDLLGHVYRMPPPTEELGDIDALVVSNRDALALISELEQHAAEALRRVDGLPALLAKLHAYAVRVRDQHLGAIGMTWVPPDVRPAVVAYLQHESLRGFLTDHDIFVLAAASAVESLAARLEEAHLADGTNLARALPELRDKFLNFIGGTPIKLSRNAEDQTVLTCRL